MTPPPARPAPPAVDLDAIRAGLEAYDAAYSDYINRGENRPDLAHYVWAQKVRALVAEVERQARAEKWLLSNLPDSVQRVYRIHLEGGKFDHD